MPPAPGSYRARLEALTDADHARLEALGGELCGLSGQAVRLVVDALNAGTTPPRDEHDRLAAEADALEQQSDAILPDSPTPPTPAEWADAMAETLADIGISEAEAQRYEAAWAARRAES